jgi:coproporphyrinogen III oxidase-like Fe-S oxidoreductase
MYKYCAGYLREKGYEHYEISSYALKESRQENSFRSRHNQIYWALDSQWYALGLGATSFVNGNIVARPRTMSDYVMWVEKFPEQEPEVAKDSPYRADALLDITLKRLRTSEGLDLDWVEQRYGEKCVQAILEGAQLGLELKFAQLDRNILRLADPEGFLYSNSIISSIIAELEDVEAR